MDSSVFMKVVFSFSICRVTDLKNIEDDEEEEEDADEFVELLLELVIELCSVVCSDSGSFVMRCVFSKDSN